MSIFRGQTIRGDQIQNRTVSGDQIIQKVLMDEHIADNAAIKESKLNINWHAHTEALEDRKVVDFVQANQISISGIGIDLEAAIPEIAGILAAGSNDSVEGIISTGPKNLAPMRDSVTGDPLVAVIDGIDYEVIARVEYVNGKFMLNFYTASGDNGSEESYDLGATAVTVDLQYARRFNLRTIDEMFACNEKFVHGAADITAHLNIQQVAKDLYGATWKLDRDGNPILATSIANQIKNETNRAQMAETALQQNLDTEIAAREQGEATLATELSSETQRASAAEARIAGDLVAESDRAKAAEATLQSNIDTEKNRAMTAESNLNDRINSLSTGTDGAVEDLQNALTAETDRAILAETNLNNKLDQEKTDRQAADATLTSALGQEIADRAAANANLQAALTSEAQTRENADAALQAAIDAEKARAISAENKLTADLAKEVSDRTDADDALQAEIDTLNGNSSVVGSVDNKIKVQVTDVLASSDLGKGASKIGISAISGMAGITTVQAALEYLKTNAGDALTTFVSDLGSQATGKGASLIAVQSGAGLEGNNVEAVLENHESRLDAIEAGNLGAGTREASANGYFAAATFATIDERFDSDETVIDANLKRIDTKYVVDSTRAASANGYFSAAVKASLNDRFADVEAVADATAKEVKDARGSKANLNERLSVALRADGFLVDDAKLHEHMKYTYVISTPTSVVSLPIGQKFNLSGITGSGSVSKNTVQVYINGILQANGINFSEIADTVDTTKGVGVDFTPEELVVGDVVVIEWVVNNAN